MKDTYPLTNPHNEEQKVSSGNNLDKKRDENRSHHKSIDAKHPADIKHERQKSVETPKKDGRKASVEAKRGSIIEPIKASNVEHER